MKIYNSYRLPPVPAEKQAQLISVIVAVYNIEDYIERGVTSILKQTYRNLEIILVDDGSTDAGGRICDRLAEEDKRVRVIHKQNGGPADARNEGIAASHGELIGFVDGDDWIDADMYEKMFSALTLQDADIAICRYRQVHRDHTEDASVDRVILFEGQEALQYYVEERTEYDIQNAAWNKLYRREVLSDLHFPQGKWYEDIMFATAALSRAQRCVYLDSACYNYIIDREGSIMNTRVNPRTFSDQIPAYREKTEFLKNLGRQDLADTHDYFFYKRLLLFYNELKRTGFSDRSEKKRYLDEITDVIYECVRKDGGAYDRIYQCSAANPNEKKKMDLFLKSPRLYWCVMILNEAIILPYKRRRAKKEKKSYDHYPDGGRSGQPDVSVCTIQTAFPHGKNGKNG